MRSEGHFKNVSDQSSALHQLRTIFYVVFAWSCDMTISVPEIANIRGNACGI